MAELEACRVTDEAVVVGLYPDVCLTPPGPTPVPYMVIARFSDGVRSRPTVRFGGVEAMTEFGRLSRVYGDEAGTGGGVTSGVNMGMCRPQTFSSSVRINGQPVVRHDDFVEMNCAAPDSPANTVGKVMYVPVGAPLPVGPMGAVAGDTNPPAEPETEEEIGFWGQVGGFFVGAGKGVADAAVGVKDLAVGGFWMSDVGQLVNPARSNQARETFQTTVGAIWDDPGLVWDGIKEPYVEAWGRGAYGEAIGRGTLEAVLAVVGTKGADKAAKGATAASRAAGAVDDVARAGAGAADNVAGAAARGSDDAAGAAASAADDAGRAAADVAEESSEAAGVAASGADDAGRAGSDGIQILGVSLKPKDFGLRTIAEDPEMHRLWEDALRNKAASSRPNAYTRYLDAIRRGETPTQDMAEAAYSTVRSEFGKLADAAGRPLGDAQVHHWNYPKGDYPLQVTDPRNLVITPDRAAHEAIHRATSGTSDIWGGPIDPRHVLPIDESVSPLAPRP